jgi:hypothetical protein
LESLLARRGHISQIRIGMDKPIVFLSHSSKDRIPLIALKGLLDKRAAGSLEFFLSSDGESIRFGRNWVARVSDALAEAKVMFVFLSKDSVDSRWIHFESGSAYAKDLRVVPVCLPGLALDRVGPPLNLLQGFNLHSHETMGNLARICNEVFTLKMAEAFDTNDFKTVFASLAAKPEYFFGEWTDSIQEIAIHTKYDSQEEMALPAKLVEIAKSHGVEATLQKPDPKTGNHRTAEVDFSGCSVWISEGIVENIQAPTIHSYGAYCTLSPQLFHLTADILDRWHQAARFRTPYWVSVHFGKGIFCEGRMHYLTTKLYGSRIRLVAREKFDFNGFEFSFGSHRTAIEFECKGGLHNNPLRLLISKLFEIGVMWQSDEEPDSRSFWRGLDVG